MTELTPWAIWLTPEDAAHASAMRLEPRVEVCVTPEGVWLRGDRSDEALENRLRRLPGARRFAVLSDGQLQAVGTIAPQGHLPAGLWQPLKDWSQPRVGEFLRNRRPVSEKPACTLRLVRSHEPAEPTLLIVPWEAWSQYADAAPQVRLECLAFALAGDGRVLVRGSPLPPLRGERWVERGGIATPAGWTWSPAVDAPVLRELFSLENHDLALLNTAGSWEHIAGSDFTRATRSAVRNTAEHIAHAG